MCFVHFVLQTRAFCQFTFDKVTNEVPALRSGPNECASPNEMTVISFGPERKCFAERKCFVAKRFARTLGRMAVTKDQARPGPGLARPAPPAGSGGAKEQKTEARAQNRGPHWTPVKLLVGGRQPELPNASVCLLPCRGQRSLTLHPRCDPTRAQAAAMSGVFVNARDSGGQDDNPNCPMHLPLSARRGPLPALITHGPTAT